MPDFATPARICSPAHAHLAAAVQDPVNDLPASLLAILWFTRRDTAQFVTIDTTAEPMPIGADPWWGRTSKHVIAVGHLKAHSSRRGNR